MCYATFSTLFFIVMVCFIGRISPRVPRENHNLRQEKNSKPIQLRMDSEPVTTGVLSHSLSVGRVLKSSA